MLLTDPMKNALHRPVSTRVLSATRPRPTSGAALLLACLLSLPFGALALIQMLF